VVDYLYLDGDDRRKKKKDWCIYRCIFGSYDNAPFGAVNLDWADCYLFTDDPNFQVSGWTTILIRPALGSGPAMENRKLKILIAETLRKYKFSVYLDGNIVLLRSIISLMERFANSGCDIGLFDHPKSGRSVKREAETVLLDGKANEEDVKREIAFYKVIDPSLLDMEISDNSILFRKHSKEMFSAMELWFDQVKRFSRRDQISLPYVVSVKKLKTYRFNLAQRRFNSYFLVAPHKHVRLNTLSRKLRVWFLILLSNINHETWGFKK